MPKKLFEAKAHAPELPRVRFMRTLPAGSKPAFLDVTRDVASVFIELLEDGSDACALVRLDEKGADVWRTIHPSLEEARLQGTHEYQLEPRDWTPCAPQS